MILVILEFCLAVLQPYGRPQRDKKYICRIFSISKTFSQLRLHGKAISLTVSSVKLQE